MVIVSVLLFIAVLQHFFVTALPRFLVALKQEHLQLRSTIGALTAIHYDVERIDRERLSISLILISELCRAFNYA